MNKQNLDKLEREMEKRQKLKEKRKRKRMKVSGGGVKKLQKIIVSSSQK
jgi:indole-3-glycerol phosphate synthase